MGVILQQDHHGRSAGHRSSPSRRIDVPGSPEVDQEHDQTPLAAPVRERLGSLEGLLVNQAVRVDCQRWADGRLVLVGDAAHAMAPNLGQGANSAIVDAAVLAADRPLERALGRYTARRRPAVAWVQDAADRLARLSRVAHPVLRRGRDVALRRFGRLATGPSRQHRVQQEDPAWLYATAQVLQRQARPPTLMD